MVADICEQGSTGTKPSETSKRSPDPLGGPRSWHPFTISAGSPWRERDVARRAGQG